MAASIIPIDNVPPPSHLPLENSNDQRDTSKNPWKSLQNEYLLEMADESDISNIDVGGHVHSLTNDEESPDDVENERKIKHVLRVASPIPKTPITLSPVLEPHVIHTTVMPKEHSSSRPEKLKILPVLAPSRTTKKTYPLLSPILPLKDYLEIQEKKREKLANALKETAQSVRVVVDAPRISRERMKTDSVTMRLPLSPMVPNVAESEDLPVFPSISTSLSRVERLLDARRYTTLSELRKSYLSTMIPTETNSLKSNWTHTPRDSLTDLRRERYHTHSGILVPPFEQRIAIVTTPSSARMSIATKDKAKKFLDALAHPINHTCDQTTQTNHDVRNVSSQTMMTMLAPQSRSVQTDVLGVETQVTSNDETSEEVLTTVKLDAECQTDNHDNVPQTEEPVVDDSLNISSPSEPEVKEDEKTETPDPNKIQLFPQSVIEPTRQLHSAPASLRNSISQAPSLSTPPKEKVLKEKSVPMDSGTTAQKYTDSFQPESTFSFDPYVSKHFKEIASAKEFWMSKRKQQSTSSIISDRFKDTYDTDDEVEVESACSSGRSIDDDDEARAYDVYHSRPGTTARRNDHTLSSKLEHQISINNTEFGTSATHSVHQQKEFNQPQKPKRVLIQSPPEKESSPSVSHFIEALHLQPPSDLSNGEQSSHPYLKQYLLRTGKDPVAAVLTAKSLTQRGSKKIKSGPGAYRSVAGLYKKKPNATTLPPLKQKQAARPRKKSPGKSLMKREDDLDVDRIVMAGGHSESSFDSRHSHPQAAMCHSQYLASYGENVTPYYIPQPTEWYPAQNYGYNHMYDPTYWQYEHDIPPSSTYRYPPGFHNPLEGIPDWPLHPQQQAYTNYFS